jgi:hypothetical protein
MIRETELSLLVPSPELIVRLASGDRPLGVRAGPPRIKAIRETFFDTNDHALRRRGMACFLRQVEGEGPSVVVTVGETPDAEGITSRSRLTAAAIGAGVFETLRGESEPAIQIKKFVEPGQLRPQLALDIHRLGRVYRGGLLLKPVLLLFFDRITVQAGDTTTVFHELSIRRRREGGPLIRDLARQLRDEYHLFPDGMDRLQRAYRLLASQRKEKAPELSPYGLSLALAVFLEGKMGLLRKGDELHIPTFRGSGEDAARALASDLTGDPDVPLLRLGTTEPRPGRAVAELWTISDLEPSTVLKEHSRLTWMPWGTLVEQAGRGDLSDPTLVSSLLLLTRRKLLGQISWLDGSSPSPTEPGDASGFGAEAAATPTAPELKRVENLLPILSTSEDHGQSLEARLKAASRLSEELSHVFFQDVTRTKGRILSDNSDEEERAKVQLLDLLSIRIRGVVDRLYRCFNDELAPGLEGAGIHFKTWAGLLSADRKALLDLFGDRYLPSMQVAPEWGPAFVPDMPMSGCAVGIFSRVPQDDGTRLFHVVLGKDPPSFIAVPGSTTVLPLDEVIRGYFFGQMPELERAETHMFRFTTGAALVREPEPEPSAALAGEAGRDAEETPPGSPGPAAHFPSPRMVETRQSVVVRVLARRRMPERYQAQLLRALERQAGRRNPLIGWSDLYPVTGPLDLSGLEDLLELVDELPG